MIVLGIDDSLVKPGYAVLDGHERLIGWARPDFSGAKLRSTLARVRGARQTLLDLLTRYHPDLIVIENTSVGRGDDARSWQAAAGLPFARGVAWATCVEWLERVDGTGEIAEMDPARARRLLTGWRGLGNPSKELGIENLRLRGYARPENCTVDQWRDVADALALALVGKLERLAR
jgi:Holliday junction resolvasome RuvABC endonuclease subunit